MCAERSIGNKHKAGIIGAQFLFPKEHTGATVLPIVTPAVLGAVGFDAVGAVAGEQLTIEDWGSWNE